MKYMLFAAGIGLSLLATNVSANGYDDYVEGIANSSVGDYVCGEENFSQKVNQALDSITNAVCNALNTDPDIENSPFAYENPQVSCGLVSSMAGLPDWDGIGFSKDGGGACAVAKMVVGDSLDGVIEKYNKVSGDVSSVTSAVSDIKINELMDKVTKDK